MRKLRAPRELFKWFFYSFLHNDIGRVRLSGDAGVSGESRVAGKTHKSCNFIFFFLLCVHSNIEFLLFVIFNRKAFFFSVAATKHFFSVFIMFLCREHCNVTEPTVFSTEFSFLLMEHFCFPLKYASKARNTLQHSWGRFFREFHSSPFSNGGFSVLLKSHGIKVRISNENYLLYYVYIKVFPA